MSEEIVYFAFNVSNNILSIKETLMRINSPIHISSYGINKPITLSIIKKAFILLDYIQIVGNIICEVNPEIDGSITLSLEYEGFLMDICITELDYIIWIEKEAEEVLYNEGVSEERILRYIKHFKNEELYE